VRTTGRLAPGAKLPGEIELAAQYGVARLTVRRAIRELVAEERLVILRGRGTYVKQRDS
jgi:DNA-binding GntR family transcriptional regulator